VSDATALRRRGAPASSAYLVGGTLVGLVALYVFLNTRMYADVLSDAAYTASYIYGTLLQSVFAIVILAVAVRIGVRQPVGRQWLLIGIAVMMYAIGDIVWMWLELFLEVDPYPSVADIFYTLEYAFFLAALVLAIRSYRGFTSIRVPVMLGAVAGSVALAIIYSTVLQPYIFPAGVEELGFWGLVVSTLYPLGDVFFMLAPAVALALVIRQLGAGKLARPWWVVVVGAFVFAIADSVYSYADWSGIGTTTLTDVGWMVANLLFALAALVALNVFRPQT
jgi:energy-converting hydrogenase Eha subunit B